MKKKLFSLLVVFALAFCLVGCDFLKPQPEPQPAEAGEITDGFFTYSFDADGSARSFYIHFYDNGVFYFSGLNGGQILVGRYEVTDTAWEGDYYADREAASPSDPSVQKHTTHGTAPQTLVFKNLAGKEIGKSGYDKASGKLYDVNAEGQPGYCQSLLFNQDLNFEPSAATGVENGVALYTFEDPEDDTCYVSINHNGSFTDMMVSQIDGTWVQTGSTYTLTPEDSTDPVVTLVIDETGKNATYKVSGEDDIALVLHEEELVVEETFVGETKVMGVVDAIFTLELYTNETASAIVTKKSDGSEMGRADGGSWRKNADTGEIDMISVGGESYAPHKEGNADSDKDIVDGKFTLYLKLNGQSVTCEVSYVPKYFITVESGAETLTFYKDFTFVATAYSGQAKMTGVWDMPSYTLNLEFTGQSVGAVTAEVSISDDDAHNMTVAFTMGEKVVSFVIPSSEWGTKLMGKVPAVLTVKSDDKKDSFTFYKDFTIEANIEAMPIAIEGNWSMPGRTLNVEFTGQASVLTANITMDQTSHDLTLQVKSGDNVIKSFVIKAADWGSILQGKAPAPAQD